MTDATQPKKVARVKRDEIAVDSALVVAALCFFSTLIEAGFGVANSLVRAAFPMANNQWSEAPLLYQLHQIAAGHPAYQSTLLANSYDYGPVYLYTLGALRGFLHQPLDQIVPLRAISMALGLLAIVPLVLCSLLLARRAGIAPNDRLANLAVVLTAVTLGVAVFSQSITFDAVHPDNLSFLLLSSVLALYYAIATKRLGPLWVIALVAVALVAVFTKQNSFAIAPVLLLALGATGALPLRAMLIGAGLYVCAIVLFFVLAPQDTRAWTFLVPSAHHYDLIPSRFAACWLFLTRWEPWVAALIVVFPLTLIYLYRREGWRSLALDVPVLLILSATAFAGFFKVLGAWNNLTLIALATVPYFSALLGILVTPPVFRTAPRFVVGIGYLLVLGVPLALGFNAKQEADARSYTEMAAVHRTSQELCRTGKRIVVTVFADQFLSCPNAKFALADSQAELLAAFPRYYVGPTTFDYPPNATYVVTTSFYPFPGAWKPVFKLERSMPAIRGWGALYFPTQFEIYRHV